MISKEILLPICGQVLLTFVVFIWMYITRIGTLHRKKIPTQSLENEAYAQEVLKDVVNPSDNFENLFEVPILFYTACLVIAAAGITDQAFVVSAWVYVALRAIHSLIHCSFNKIILRFIAYFLSTLVLMGIWIRIGMLLFTYI